MDWGGSVGVDELIKLGYGVLLGIATFFLQRTVKVLDKLENRSEKHDTRITVLEVTTGIRPGKSNSGGRDG